MVNKTLVTDSSDNPRDFEVFITKNKSRLKIYDDKVFMRNGETFELEIFNAFDLDIMVLIDFDGKPMSNNGLIVKPGQRVFLERYLDKNSKFKFETYDSDGSEAGQRAIAKNGDVEVKIYKEKIAPKYTPVRHQLFHTDYRSTGRKPRRDYSRSAGTIPADTGMLSFASEGIMSLGDVRSAPSPEIYDSAPVETGQVGEGASSDQHFKYITKDFERYSTLEYKFKILPESHKETYAEDIKNYCSNCGRRSRSREVYCPKCGTKQ